MNFGIFKCGGVDSLSRKSWNDDDIFEFRTNLIRIRRGSILSIFREFWNFCKCGGVDSLSRKLTVIFDCFLHG